MTYLYVFIFLSVWACPIGHTTQAVQSRRRPDLPGAACLISSTNRCSVSSVRACVPCMVCLASGTACAAACAVQSARVRWSVQRHTGGVYSRRQAPPGQSLYHRKNKKGSKITPPPLPIFKISRKKQKDPYKGSVFCAILALQALKGRNLQWLKVK